MIYKFFSSAKHCVNIPQFNWQFMHNFLQTAGSSFSCSLVFYVEVVSIAPYVGNPVTNFPLKVSFARLLVFKVYSVTNIIIR